MCNILEVRCVVLSPWKVSRVGEKMPAQGRVVCLKSVGKMVPKTPGLNYRQQLRCNKA